MEHNELKRVKWLDSVKGIAILLVVFGHVVESISKAHILVTPYEVKTIYKIVILIHMPLFFCMSGYLFALAYVRTGKIRVSRWKQQIGNLLLLYVGWSFFYWCFKFFFSKYVNQDVDIFDFLWIPLKAIQHHWYLYVMIILYLVVVPINAINRINGNFKWLFLFIGAGLSMIKSLIPADNNVTMLKVPCFFFFFYLGYFLQQGGWEKVIKSKRVLELMFIDSLILGFIWLNMKNICDSLYVLSACEVLFVTSIILLCISLCEQSYIQDKKINQIMQYFGSHSLEIYLLHVYLTAGLRPIIVKMGISSYAAVFTLLMSAGIIVPLLISYVLKKTEIWDLMFRPGRVLRKIIDNKQSNVHS